MTYFIKFRPECLLPHLYLFSISLAIMQLANEHGSEADAIPSTQPLLRHSGDHDEPVVEKIPSMSKDRTFSSRVSLYALIHVTLVVVYSALYIFAVNYLLERKVSTNSLPLPAREAIKPQLRYFTTDIKTNPFAGTPRPELEDAWHNLLENDNIYLPRKFLDALNLNTIYTRDGINGIASLSIFHALHCLKLIRQTVYLPHYHPNLTGTALQRHFLHTDHCIEYLRESLTCHPDISLVTFRWINDTAQHRDEPNAFYPTNFDAGIHECNDWSAINEWAGERRWNLWNLEGLNRPGA